MGEDGGDGLSSVWVTRLCLVGVSKEDGSRGAGSSGGWGESAVCVSLVILLGGVRNEVLSMLALSSGVGDSDAVGLTRLRVGAVCGLPVSGNICGLLRLISTSPSSSSCRSGDWG